MKKQNRNPNSGRKEFGDYILGKISSNEGKTLGEGTFGKVKLATHKLTGQHVAIKILQKSKIQDVADVERVSRQIHILKLIRHPNIVQLYEIIQTPKQLLLIMQFMEQGQLFDYIVTSKRIKEEQASRLFHQLIGGIEYIHKIGVAHRDLKPQNLLLDYRKSLKIVDFGLSNTYKGKQLLKTPCGSPCYAAPEMIRGEKYDGLKVDIWSSGVILFAMVCGYLPFEDPQTSALYTKILSGKCTFHNTISPQAKDLIEKILNGDQSARLTIEQIRNHPWMKSHQGKQQPSAGIIVGFNKIPIDTNVLNCMKNMNMDSEYVGKCLEANRHNNVTTAYYLCMKKFIKEGGTTSCDLSSKSFDRSLIEPNRRKQIDKTFIITDNFFSKTTEGEREKRKSSKQKNSKEKINITTELKKNRTSSKNKQPKIDSSFNYGHCKIPLTSKSIEKNTVRRDSQFENRISRKYKEKYDQSLHSKSKDKIQQRSRVNSSIHGNLKKCQNPDFSNFMEEYQIKGGKKAVKKTCSMSIKCDNKLIKAKRC